MRVGEESEMRVIRKILVPVDFSPCSSQAVDYAAFLAKELGADVDVMHAWHPSQEIGPIVGAFDHSAERDRALADFVQTDAGKELKRVLFRLEARGVNVHGRLEAGSPRHAIVDAAAHGDYDLIVMGTHGRTGLAHVVAGSVAEWVVRHAPVPVLTVRDSLATVGEPAEAEETVIAPAG
jgi:nucleotide-binding universal stress UspA family protein